MIIPNKVVTVEASALGLTSVILERGPEPISILELYEAVARKFESIDQFLLTIDLLYVLGRIDVDFKTKILTYAD
jgi:hypothetical protein